VSEWVSECDTETQVVEGRGSMRKKKRREISLMGNEQRFCECHTRGMLFGKIDTIAVQPLV
jgi:hypothetical protein